ncbi:hypothetical protein [Bowmanella pacifica]|uniref:Uncharacterized protein n=1 Tax=Bowmanella pacifica TaxID=502051 RepID=A0A918DIM6_9ALTE|nr:hypothetical protein [Bowmanella pacifica]GGO66370.1 hypothetical protein GCM10010982_10400 [Bowmanella pacifica]
MKYIKSVFTSLFLLMGVFTLAACEPGPAERTGEKIDETIEDVGNKLEDTCEEAKEKAGMKDDDC